MSARMMLAAVAAFLTFGTVLYGLFAFGSWQLYPGDWKPIDRGLYAFLMGVAGLPLAAGAAAWASAVGGRS